MECLGRTVNYDLASIQKVNSSTDYDGHLYCTSIINPIVICNYYYHMMTWNNEYVLSMWLLSS